VKIRLARYLAQAGIDSRRKCEDLVLAGLVTVDGDVVVDPATRVDPGTDEVAVRGEPVRARHGEGSPQAPIVVALHKPAGVLTSRSGPALPDDARTVYDLVEEPQGSRLVYVGRLDRDTEGLLLMTSRGDLAHRLTHPSAGVEREYVADVSGPFDEARLARAARAGIVLPGGTRTAPFRARVVSSGKVQRVELVLTEGRNREVRRIITACGGRVERLVRVRFAFVTLNGIDPGAWRELTPGEIRGLMERVGVSGPLRGATG